MSSPGTLTRIHLVRHGAVAAPWHERIYGDLDVPLSKLGERQSRDLAHRLKTLRFDAVISSGLDRAAFLAQLLAQQSGLEAGVDPRLRELNRGDWAGWGRDQVNAALPGAWEEFWAHGGIFPVPGGETLPELQARVGAALEDLSVQYEGRGVLLVAHKWVLRAALCPVLGLPLERSPRLHVPHVGAVTLERGSHSAWRLAHLSWQVLGGWAQGNEG